MYNMYVCEMFWKQFDLGKEEALDCNKDGGHDGNKHLMADETELMRERERLYLRHYSVGSDTVHPSNERVFTRTD